MSLLRCVVLLGAFPMLAFAQAPKPATPPTGPTPIGTAPAAKATIAAAIYSTRGDEKAHLVSLPDLRPLAVYDAGAGAHELAISADGRWAIGSAYGGPGPRHQPADKRLYVLDLPSGTRKHLIDLGTSERPNDIAFVGSTSTAIVTTEKPAQLLRVDAALGTFTAFALEHRTNHMLALDPAATTCFVSHVLPGGLTRFDLATNRATAHLVLPDGAEGLCVGSDGKTVWVGCNRSDKLVLVDGETMRIAQEVPCPGFPLRVKRSPDGAHVAVSKPKSGEVALYDGKDATKVRVLDLTKALGGDCAPTSLAFAPDSRTLLVVANGEPDRLCAIDVATLRVVANVDAAGPIADALAAGMVQAPAAK